MAADSTKMTLGCITSIGGLVQLGIWFYLLYQRRHPLADISRRRICIVAVVAEADVRETTLVDIDAVAIECVGLVAAGIAYERALVGRFVFTGPLPADK